MKDFADAVDHARTGEDVYLENVIKFNQPHETDWVSNKENNRWYRLE
jgi:hypothetical protein